MMKQIYVTKAYLPPKEEYIEKISKIWDSHILTNMGPLHQELEEKLTEYLEVPHCLAFCNGHMALEMAIQAMDLEGEVITTPYTFASTTHAIVRNGLTPVFCDIKESDYTIDTSKMETLITERTCAIVPVHVYGQICDVDEIQRIADQYGLKVIYDAAHAFGESYRGKTVGNYGDASIYSFHATKTFNSIEGGAVAFADADYGKKLYQLKNFGIIGEDNVGSVGANAKMSEFHAAMGLCNLDHLQEIWMGRKRAVERYRAALTSLPGIRVLPPQKNVVENYAYFPILVDENAYGHDREWLYHELGENGIHARRYFYPLTKDFVCYQNAYPKQDTPVADYVTNRILTLPLYDSLPDEDVDRICQIIAEKARHE